MNRPGEYARVVSYPEKTRESVRDVQLGLADPAPPRLPYQSDKQCIISLILGLRWETGYLEKPFQLAELAILLGVSERTCLENAG